MINLKAFLISMWLFSLPIAVDVPNNKQTMSTATIRAEPTNKNAIGAYAKNDFVNISEALVYMMLDFVQ